MSNKLTTRLIILLIFATCFIIFNYYLQFIMEDHTYSSYSLTSRPASAGLDADDSTSSINNLGNNFIIIFYFS